MAKRERKRSGNNAGQPVAPPDLCVIRGKTDGVEDILKVDLCITARQQNRPEDAPFNCPRCRVVSLL